MAARIEDYAMIGDTHTAALVSRDGSVDWLCLPRFDSGACFAALLGDESHGRWRLAPAAEQVTTRRRYRGDTLVLETEHETPEGMVRVVEAMAPRLDSPVLVRVVEGLRGRVRMTSELRIRFDFGGVLPWVRRREHGLIAVAGPDALTLHTDVPLEGRDFATFADFEVAAGQTASFTLAWHPSHQRAPRPREALALLDETEAWWSEWMAPSTYDGEWQEAVRRSLVVLKGLTYAPTGGIVAAPTTSLPEALGGVRNWDYRYCWLRDATLTLLSLVYAGFDDEAKAWREWLLRAIAGDPARLQIMYGVGGERRLTEYQVPWLPGYEGSAPVRVGNAAVEQFQLDVYGEVMDALYVARSSGLSSDEESWELQRVLLDFLETGWAQPDEGIWEVRGPRRHFVHSKVMAWVAVDRAVRSVEEFGHSGPVERWRALRSRIHEEVCANGWDAERSTFTQYYGSRELDAATLMIPLVGFLPPDDPRSRGTVAAVERELTEDGFVLRYSTSPDGDVDGLPGREGAFLACTFWLADNHALAGDRRRGREIFERLLDLRNDVGLLAEEWDTRAGRQVGNFPQAFSHVPLVNTARHLSRPADSGHAHPRRATRL